MVVPTKSTVHMHAGQIDVPFSLTWNSQVAAKEAFQEASFNVEMEKRVHIIQCDCDLPSKDMEVVGLAMPPLYKSSQQSR
ncbi:hypothetical protein A2U01_0018800, partial [Trifolium medium]|nr:hypothetical protein [Trifolium medium]